MAYGPSMEGSLPRPPQSSRLIRFATAGVAAYSAVLLLMLVYRTAVYPVEPGHTLQVMAGAAIIMPPTVWLVLSAARNVRSRGHGWVVAAVAVAVIGGGPILGANWLGAFHTLAALVLIVFRPPWSLVMFAGVAAIPGPLAVAFGHLGWAWYFTLGLLLHAPPLAVLVWLIRRTRELRAARLVLAQEAVVRERLRIETELRNTLGAALEKIADYASRAEELAGRDPSEVARVLSVVVGYARRTLAAARRLVTQYQTVSLRAELETAAALLEAAGIQTQLVLPPGVPLDAATEPLRSDLRSGTARLLGDGTVRSCLITVRRRDGRVELDMRGASGQLTPSEKPARLAR